MRLWLLLPVPLMMAAAAHPRLEPGVPLHAPFASAGERQEFSLEGLGGGLIVVESQRGGAFLSIDGSRKYGHTLEVARQWEWVYAPPGTRIVSVSPADSDPGASFTISYHPYAPEPSQSADPIILASLATAMSEDDEAERLEAEHLYERALATWPEDGFVTEHVAAIVKLADLLRRDGRHKDSLQRLRQARRLLPQDDPRQKWLRFNIGAELEELGKDDQALASFCRVLSLSTNTSSCEIEELKSADLKDRYWTASAANYIGLIHHDRGEWSEGKRWYDMSLETLPEWAESRRALIVGNLGGIAYDRGDYTTALDRLDDAQKMFEARQDSHNLSSIEANRAAVFMKTGQLDLAITHYQRALSLEDSSKTSAGQLYAQRQIGRLYLLLGDTEHADEFLSESYGESRKYHNQGTAYAALHLGRLRRATGDAVQATQLHEEALDIFVASGYTPNQFEALLDLAVDDLAAARTSDAESRLGEAARLLSSIDDLRLQGRFHNIQGVLMSRKGKLDEALAAFDKALAAQHASGDHLGQIDTSFQKALALESEGRLTEALVLLRSAEALIDQWRLGVSSHSLRASLTGTLMDVPGKQIELLMRLDRPAEALNVALSSRMRVLFESIAYEADSSNDEDRQRVQQLKRLLTSKSQARAEFVARWFANREPDQIREVHVHELAKLDEDIKRITVALDSAETQLMTGQVGLAPPSSVAALQSSLTDPSVLLVFWIGHQQGWRWDVSASAVRVQAIPGRARMEKLISDAYEDWASARRFPTDSMMALASTMLAGLDASMHSDIFVIPDDLTALVPFNALPTEDGSALVVSSRVTVVPAASMMEQREPGTGKNVALIVSDPIFDTTDPRASSLGPPRYEVQYPPLRFSYDEALAVDAVLKQEGFQTTDLTQYRANKSSFVSLASSARVLHIATHGLVDKGLLFSRLTPEGRTRTGLLSIAEIYDLRLSADLVVLSACDSAVGNRILGEGPISLARAFLIGGARQVIASLWPVDDATTKRFMAVFYEAWSRTGSAAEALREAQLNMVSRPRWRAARNWGAFVLVGR